MSWRRYGLGSALQALLGLGRLYEEERDRAQPVAGDEHYATAGGHSACSVGLVEQSEEPLWDSNVAVVDLSSCTVCGH